MYVNGWEMWKADFRRKAIFKLGDVSNKQAATVSYIDLFFLIYFNLLYMFRATNSPIFRSTFWLYIQLLVQRTDTAADRWPWQYRYVVPKAVYTVKKCSWRWASLSPETCTVHLKRSIYGMCCILLVAYVLVLMTHGLTNVKQTIELDLQ